MSDVVRSVRVVFDSSGVVRSLSSQETSAKSAADKMSALASENARAISSYDKLRATLDPTTAAHLKYSAAARTLDDSLRRGIATQSEHAALLAAAKSKYLDAGEGASKFSQLLERVDKLTGVAGKSVHEMGENLDGVKGKFVAIKEVLDGLTATQAAALGALAGSVIALAAAFEGFKVLKEIISDGIKTEAIYTQLDASLRSNGAAAGYSSRQLIEYAEALVNVTGRSKDEIVQGELILTRFTKLGHDVYPQAVKAALNLAATGKPIEESFTRVGALLEGNARSLQQFKDIGIVLSARQRATLTDLIETGRIAEYQAEVFKLLKGHIGEAAEEYARHLGGSLTIAREKIHLLQESISSEVIPALQDMFDDIVRTAGGYEKFDEKVKGIGHSIGDKIRDVVYGAIEAWHDYNLAQDQIFRAMEQGLKYVVDFTLEAVARITEALSKASTFLGGNSLDAQIKEIRALKSEFDQNADSKIKAYTKDAEEQAAAIIRVTAAWAKHKQALEGDDQVQKNHGSLEDEIARKVKGAASVFLEAAKAIREYTEKYNDLLVKQEREIDQQDDLLSAARRGTAAYNEVRKAQENENFVIAAADTLYHNFRAEIDKLHDAKQKLINLKDSAGAAAIDKDIDKATDAYIRNDEAVRRRAKSTIDNRQATADDLVETRQLEQEAQHLADIEARLTDAFTGNTDASTRNAIQADLTRLKIELGKKSIDELSKSLVESVTRLHETEKAFKDLEPAVKAITDLEHSVRFDIAVSKIDTSIGVGLQAVEQKYLSFLQTIGQGSIDRGSAVIQALAAKLGITIDELVNRIKGDLSKAEEIQFSSQFRGLGQSDLSKFEDDIFRIKQAMADGVLSVADGTAAIAKKTEDFWNNELGLWSSGLSYIAQHTGSFFRELADFVNKLQGAKGFGSNVGSLASSFGASSGAAAGLSTAAFEIGIVLAIVDTVEEIWAKHNLKKLGNYAQLIITDTSEGVTALDKNGIAAVAAIRKTIGEFASALGGMVGSIEAVGIRVRNDGKAVAAYVGGQFIGYFADIDSAVKAALLNELQSGKAALKGLPALVAQGLEGLHLGTGEGLDDLLNFEEKLKQISQLTFADGAIQVTDTISKMNDLWSVLAKMTTISPEVAQGFVDIGNTIVNSFASWRRSITGETQSPAELLAAKEAEAKLFNAQKALEIARLEQQKFDLQGQEAYLKGKAAGYQGDAELSKGDLHNKKAYLEAKHSIIVAEGDLTSEAIKLFNAQINAIDESINALKSIPDIDLSKIKLPKLGKGAGGVDSVQEVRDALEQARISRLGEEGQSLANINAKYDELNKKAGKNADLLAQVAKARQSEIDALSAQARAQSLTPYLGGQFSGSRTDYAKQLRDAAAAEADLTANAGPLKLALTDISDAFREQGRELGLQVLSGIGDTTASITLQYEKTGQAIDFLKSHMADLSLTAEQVASSLSQLSSRTELSIFGGIQQYITDETTIAKYKEIQYELDIADAKTKLALAYESNALSLEAYNRIGAILYGLPDTAPASTLQGSATSAAQSQVTAADTQLQAAQTAKDAAEKLTQWQHSLMTSPETSPLAPRAQLERSKLDLDTVIAKALAGDTTAKDKFTSVADDYLKLFVSTLGRTGAYAAEALRLSGVADILKTVLPNNPAQNVVLFPGYSPSGVGAPALTSGSRLGTPPPPPTPGGSHRLPTDADPRVIDHLTSVDDRLGPNSDLLKSIKAAGVDAATHHARVIPIFNTQTAHLQNISDSIGKVQSYLERVLEQLRTRKTGTDG